MKSFAQHSSWPTAGRRRRHYKSAGLLLNLVIALASVLMWVQFRGGFDDNVELKVVAARSGLSMDDGARVTYNGVEVGRVTRIEAITVGGVPKAKITITVRREFIDYIPRNVITEIKAGTVFGNKYVAFSSPQNPAAQTISTSQVIDVSSVTTELNTLFETIVAVAHQVDPIKLNATLTATAQALDGLGARLGHSIDDANTILADLNPRLPQFQRDAQRVADLADVYSNAAPEFFDSLRNGAVVARTLNVQQADLDRALMSAIGFGGTGDDVVGRAAPYLVRGAADLVPTAALLDEYSPALFCTIRNFHDVAPKVTQALGSNGYSAFATAGIVGAPGPYVYPDNLPRVNAKGGPEGRPGCWQPITKDLWPAPYLVMDTGASKAPYNHFGLGLPFASEYVWGRQLGGDTINP